MFDTFAYLITSLRKDFTEFCNENLQEMGLTQGLLFFILYAGKHPQCSPKELTEALHMDAGYCARTLAKLEEKGFLVQERNPADRRARMVTLTEEGEKVFHASYDLFAKWDKEVLKDLTPSQKAELMDTMKKISAERRQMRHV